jgi:protein-disulfide isomerase
MQSSNNRVTKCIVNMYWYWCATMGKMKNLPLLIGTIIGTLLLIFGVAFFYSGGTSPAGQSVVDPAQAAGDARNAKGPETAPVTIVEFSDLQCPACRVAQPLVSQITTEFPEQVRLIFRHFPLDSIHMNARLAAQASEVAAEYELFWEYHDLLFAKQSEWEKITSRDELKALFAEYAEQLEIDKTEFASKIDSQQVVDAVQADAASALQLGVNATPTFYVNGVQTSAPELRATVESVLQSTSAE